MSNVAGKAYGMNVITPMKPWKTWFNTLIFRVSRLLPETLGGLLGLSLIHFARWVMIRRKQWPDLGQGPQTLQNDYMLFCSNFNGTWDQYIDAFSDGIPNGLDMFWYASTKYPQSIPITPFKDYILHNQIDTTYYYNATPGSAQRDIKSALKLYQTLRALAERHPKLSPQLFAEAYRAALVEVQNCLGSPGYAPVASNDTREADWNRGLFVDRTQDALQEQPLSLPPTVAAPPGKAEGRSDFTTSFDGGHYFLTVLAPVRNTRLTERSGVRCSAVQRLRDVLATLPTALQSQATEDIGLNSPFARNKRTHLARFVVIDDVPYNGRESDDALVTAACKIRPVTPQPQDRLSCPYLLFAADFDAKDGSAETLRGYLGELWATMEPELRAIFGNCFGFERVGNAASFCDYVMACEVETTMPFNDYWVGKPPLKSRLLSALLPAIILLVPLALFSIFLVFLLVFGNYRLCDMIGRFWAILSGVTVALYVAYRRVMAVGAEPFPAAPDSDLPAVLKALYLQRHFIRHFIATQGADDATLYDAFGRFADEHQPGNIQQPTQAPGVIGLREQTP
ncbi:MAG TPA: hypothetical protein VI298_10860 [Geobacteraceae bacterium]